MRRGVVLVVALILTGCTINVGDTSTSSTTTATIPAPTATNPAVAASTTRPPSAEEIETCQETSSRVLDGYPALAQSARSWCETSASPSSIATCIEGVETYMSPYLDDLTDQALIDSYTAQAVAACEI